MANDKLKADQSEIRPCYTVYCTGNYVIQTALTEPVIMHNLTQNVLRCWIDILTSLQASNSYTMRNIDVTQEVTFKNAITYRNYTLKFNVLWTQSTTQSTLIDKLIREDIKVPPT